MTYTPQTWSDLPAQTTPLSAARLNYIEQGIANLGVMQSWTPSSITGITLGNASVDGSYCQIGKLVFLKLRIAVGSTSSITGPVVFSLPVNANALSVAFSSQAWLLDNGSSSYSAFVRLVGTTTAQIFVTGVNGALSNITSTLPFTWAQSDQITAGIVYEAA